MAEYSVEKLALSAYESVKKGDVLLFGSYPQTQGGALLPITWEVLDIKDGSFLLLSTHGIDAMAYDQRTLDLCRTGRITWESSALRAWLNDRFWYTAFNASERARIAPARLSSNEDVEPDKIFCLSPSEAAKYNKTRATPYRELAKEHGARPYFWNGGTEWWLRTPSDDRHAYYVSAEWGTMHDGTSWFSFAVRPALWFDPAGEYPTELPDVEAPEAKSEEREEISESVSAPKEHAPVDCKKLRPGSFVTLGTYESGEGKSPIEWQVLDLKLGKALLISVKGIDTKPFHNEFTTVTWESSSVRAWLNGEFFSTAFSESEKALIVPAELDNEPHPQTLDKVFFLSEDEVQKYFGGDIGDTRGHAAPTAYALAQGAHLHTASGTCSWWLRTPSCSYPDNHTMIFCYTSLLFGGDKVNDAHTAIRPAVWISLN